MMETCEAFIIGGSAGSLDVLLKVLPALSAALSFPIIIVLHRKPGKDKLLTDLFSSRARVEVKDIEEKDEILPGTIFLAPSDYHLLIEENKTFSLDASDKINYSRPSIDVTFESASLVYKEKLFCLLLSGSNADGTDGLLEVKSRGGKVLIQDPLTATSSYMPEHARQNLVVDYTLKPEEIAAFLNNLSQ